MNILLSPNDVSGAAQAARLKPDPAAQLKALADEANAVKAALQSAHDLAQKAYANIRAAGLPGLTENYLNTARGCAATALQHLGVHVQGLNAKLAPVPDDNAPKA